MDEKAARHDADYISLWRATYPKVPLWYESTTLTSASVLENIVTTR